MKKVFLGFSQKQKIKLSVRVLLFSIMGLAVAFVSVFIWGNIGSTKKAIASTGMHGARTVSSANTIVNEYTYLTSNKSSGSTSLSVSNSSLNANGRFSGNLAAGELLMIIQMQGASMSTANSSTYGSISNYNNAGKFEFVEVQSVPSSTKINLVTGLANSYTSSGHVQVIRVPRYASLTITGSGSVTCPSWDGTTGGVVAIESNGSTVIDGSISVSGKGFRGGATEQNTQTPGDHSSYLSTDDKDGAEKGEGIAGSQSDYSSKGKYGRGAPANGGGGGNSHNAGGGGGANGGDPATWDGMGNPYNLNSNWTTAWNLESAGFSSHTSSGGGRGGYTWSNASKNPITTGPGNSGWSGDNRTNAGGFGGRPLTYTSNRIFMGGGGGAGDSNNGVGTNGGTGGGIVYLLSGGNVSGTGSINANGSDVPLSSGNPGDASGGGGGGGTIFIFTYSAGISNLTLNANGGTGGSQSLNNGDEVEGLGGGGGGGYISTSNALSLTRNVSGGVNGATDAPPMNAFAANGATRGAAGTITTGTANPYTTSTPLPIELKAFSVKKVNNTAVITWITSSEINNDYFSVERSSDGEHYMELVRVLGAGNSTQDIEYSYTDDAPASGDNYYRLTQTDYDGTQAVFNAVHLDFDNSSLHQYSITWASPNPFTDRLHVEYYSENAGTVEFRIVGANGQVLRKYSAMSTPGQNSFDWNSLSELPQGIYFLNLTVAGKSIGVRKLFRN
ncbi:MAG: T9SS type A sorting domain-containing protein [Bacteroidia bacterium]|nr:T9SS type A sorting domain-containing protein [Bacteroidia bacterium]